MPPLTRFSVGFNKAFEHFLQRAPAPLRSVACVLLNPILNYVAVPT